MRYYQAVMPRLPLNRLNVGDTLQGRVTDIRPRLGVFVDVGASRDGLIREADLYGESLEIGEDVLVRIINLDIARERLGLTLAFTAPAQEEVAEATPSVIEEALRRAGAPVPPAPPPQTAAPTALSLGQSVQGTLKRLTKHTWEVEMEDGVIAELVKQEAAGMSEGETVTLWVKSAEPGKRPKVTRREPQARVEETSSAQDSNDVLKRMVDEYRKQKGDA